MKCTSCGSESSPGARFCSTCGAPLSVIEEERRVVTVLFADIVGFTGLAEHLDPEQVKRRVDACFERLALDITSFGGVVDKVLGDGIIALFGAPVAHEDDAERAVRAGLRMQQAAASMTSEFAPSLQLRIGINTGEVLVGNTSTGRDYTAMGDVVNSASRFQSLADPGQVLVGEATHTATKEAISYHDLGELEVKGRQGTLRTWVALSAVRPPGSRSRRIAEFVGREYELKLLHAQADLAFARSQAQIATVFGEAGAGKTRLVEEAAGQLASRFGARVLEGRCVPYGEANVWWPFADVLRHVFGLETDSAENDAANLVEASLAKYYSTLSGVPTGDLHRIHTALMHALGFATPLRGGDRLRNRAEVTLAITQLMSVELERRPVVLVLSDVHWAAEGVWRLLQHLLNELSRSRLLVLVTARRSETDRAVDGRFGSVSVELGPLDNDAALQLVAKLGIELPADQVEELIERSGGNPFFLEELAMLVSNRSEPVAGAIVPTLDQIPDNLRGILAARLDRLAPSARSLLEAAAVLGRSSSVDALRIIAREMGISEDISSELATLETADLVAVHGNRYEFLSDLVREVAYATITKTVRAQRHAGIARYLEDTQQGPVRNSRVVAIARHYRAAAELIRELHDVSGLDTVEIVSKALQWLDDAGWRALEAGVPKDAIDWFGSGLELSNDDESQARFLLGRAKARCEIRDVIGTRSDLERLDAFSRHDPLLAAQVLVVSGDIDQKAGDLDRSAGLLREAADRLEALGEGGHQALALRLLGRTEMLRGDEPMALQAFNAAREVAAASGNPRELAWTVQSLAWFAFRAGRVTEASAFVVEAKALFEELDDRGGLAWTKGVEAWVAFHEGDWELAKTLVAEVLPETRRRGDPWAEAIMLSLETSMALWSGESRRALELARETQALAEKADEFSLAVQVRALEGRALISRGRVLEGIGALEQSFALSDRAGDDESRRIAVSSNCAASVRLGDPERVIRWAARFDGALGDPTVVGESDLSVSLALALLQRGAVDEASSQISWIDSFEGDRRVNSYGQAVGAIVASALDERELAVSKASTVLEGPSTYLDRTMARLALAAVAYRMGDADGFDLNLDEARAILVVTDDLVTPLIVDLFAAVGGRGDVDGAEAALRLLSIDPTGWRNAWSLATGVTPAISSP